MFSGKPITDKENKLFDIVVKVTEAEGEADPLLKTNLDRASPYISLFQIWLKKKHFIHYEHFTLLDSQNIIRTPFEIPFQKKHHLDPLSKENLEIGFPIYFIIQNGWKQNVFHSFWELLPFLNPPFKKASSRSPFKRKFG